MFRPELNHQMLLQCQQTREILAAKCAKGPWLGEPDRDEWQHKGVQCLIIRQSQSFHLCGYVGVPPAHPLHGKSYHEVDLSAHGGLTYSEGCNGVVCHRAKPGEPDELWWFGFDAAHWGDFKPSDMLIFSMSYGLYRDFEYMRSEVNDLAEQIAAAGIRPKPFMVLSPDKKPHYCERRIQARAISRHTPGSGTLIVSNGFAQRI